LNIDSKLSIPMFMQNPHFLATSGVRISASLRSRSVVGEKKLHRPFRDMDAQFCGLAIEHGLARQPRRQIEEERESAGLSPALGLAAQAI
jgi:hypothetical protein